MHVIPAPTRIESRGGAPFILSATTSITAPTEVADSVAWFRGELATATGLTIHSGMGHDQPAIRIELVPDDPDLAGLPVTGGIRADDGDARGERYGLEIAADGVAIRAASPEGAFRALTTLLQGVATSPAGSDGTIPLPAASILDTPRFAWRGLCLDVARSFLTVAEVERVIDLLALYKGNVLHLHLTDAEGWRLEIDAWPNLTRVGALPIGNGRPGGFYSKEEYAGLVRYAAERFVTVVPEIEMPGHTGAIFRSYPDLAGNGTEAPDPGEESYLQVMHPDNPGIVPFLGDVLAEVAAMTPGAFIHLGGDEALGLDGETYRRFMRLVMPLVHATGKNVVAWQEVARAGFAPGEVAQLWISPDHHDALDLEADPVSAAFAGFQHLAHLDLDAALAQGARILISQQSRCYLDTAYREAPADPRQAADHDRLGASFYLPSTVAEFFDWEPGQLRAGLDEAAVAGVEAAIWAEGVESLADAFFLMLPRLPGVLEKGWSPGGGTWAAYAPRIAAQAAVWERRGWPYFRSSVVWEMP